MADYDFPKTAEPPHLASLAQSYAVDQREAELRNLFIKVFRSTLSTRAFDVILSGCAHLGSFDSVRKAINADGLTILQGDREEYATRYLYRAWQARDVNGRGLHFLRTYLQLLYPNQCRVAQLWQAKDKPYTTDMHSPLEITNGGAAWVPDPEKYWLTSRLEIALDLSVENRTITTLANIFRSIVPARLVPQFRFWLRFEAQVDITAHYFLYLNKHSVGRLHYGTRVITRRPEAMWKLGRRGQKDNPKLGGTQRVFVSADWNKDVEVLYKRIPKIGEPGRKLDGTWKIPCSPRIHARFEMSVTR